MIFFLYLIDRIMAHVFILVLNFQTLMRKILIFIIQIISLKLIGKLEKLVQNVYYTKIHMKCE